MGRWSAAFLLPLLAVACVSRPLSGEDAGADESSTGDMDDDGTPPPATSASPTTTPDPTTAGSATAGSTVTDPSGVDTLDDGGDDHGDDGCAPDGECQVDTDCAPGQTCLANCTCFGDPDPDPTDTGDPECGDAGSCEACLQCAALPGGDCQTALLTCLGNSECAALLLCQAGCDNPQCLQDCVFANPGGLGDFLPVVECLFSTCAGPCS